MRRTLLRFAVAVTVSFGCGQSIEDELPDAREPEQQQQSLINGYYDWDRPNVGLVYPSGCTATLIGRRTAITAAHCVNYNGEPSQFCMQRGPYSSETRYCVNGTAYSHPSYTTSGGLAQNDVAVVRLSSDAVSAFASSGVAVKSARIANFAPTNGAGITIVGFGCTTRSNTTTGYGERRSGYNTISGVEYNRLKWRESSGTAQLCPGDSGGPVFMGQGGDCHIGINSGYSSNVFGTDDWASRTDYSFTWIRDLSGDPTVYACGQAACGDGMCHVNESCSSCPGDCGSCACGDGICDKSRNEQCASDCCLEGSYWDAYSSTRTLSSYNDATDYVDVVMSCGGSYTWTLTGGSCPGGWYAYDAGMRMHCSLGSGYATFQVSYGGGTSRSITFY